MPAWLLLLAATAGETTLATDHFLTLGGGYSPEGNQASLEANVQFFQRVLETQHPGSLTHSIYFADGFDAQPDLQIVLPSEKSDSAAVNLIREIFAPPSPPGTIPGTQQLGYRNHRVTGLSGSNRIEDVRAGLANVKSRLKPGDRLVVYVTAHGGSADRDGSPFNTSITCWGQKDLTMEELSEWLDSLPTEVPVVLVMAQCYCGGFAQTIFTGGDSQLGFAKNMRTGFYAQRHDLPAAGCRPDIENDEEYSSYFWGAFMQQTRTGRPAAGGDYDRDGRVSFAEAHALAVIESETIDIPTRGSDAYLRQVSRIPNYQLDIPRSESEDNEADDSTDDDKLSEMSGTLDELLAGAARIDQSMITGLAKRLDIRLSDDVTSVFSAYEDSQREYRAARRGGFGRRGRGGFSRRRELQQMLIEKWPELANEDQRLSDPLLQGSRGEELVAEIKEMEAYQEYIRIRDQRIQSRRNSLTVELEQVLLRRLIHTLESVVLARNLQFLATPDEQTRYQELLKLEAAFLNVGS